MSAASRGATRLALSGGFIYPIQSSRGGAPSAQELICRNGKEIRNAIHYRRERELRRHRALLRRPWLGATHRADPRIPIERCFVGETSTGASGCGLSSDHLRPQRIRQVEPANRWLQL